VIRTPFSDEKKGLMKQALRVKAKETARVIEPMLSGPKSRSEAIPMFRPHVQDVLIPAKNGIRCADPAVPRLATVSTRSDGDYVRPVW
jgi:hypothetical protein